VTIHPTKPQFVFEAMAESFSLGQLSAKLDAKLYGDETIEIFGVATLEKATAGQIAFLDNAKYLENLSTTAASAVLTSEKFVAQCGRPSLIVSNPKLSLAKLLQLFYPPPDFVSGIHPTAVIGNRCEIDPSVTIAPHVVIGDDVRIKKGTVIGAGSYIGNQTSIGECCRFNPRVSIYHEIKIGSRVVLHSGVVIGADGFGFERTREKIWEKIPQIGSVWIGDDVEIGANSAVDRGTLDNTIIGNGVKIDNQVMIGHNVQIGDHTIIAGCTGIAGSTKIGRYCLIGGATAINDHIVITDNVMVAGMAMVVHSLTEPGIYASGTGILRQRDWHRAVVRFKQLEEIYQRVKKLEEKVS